MTPTITRILVPLDFSAHSQRALDYATELAVRTGASLHLLNVVEPIEATVFGSEMYVPSLPEITDNMVAESRRQIARCAAGLPRGVTATTEVAIGPAATTITDTASDRTCDLIVMGTHGRTGLGHLFMGSVAERVTRLAPCPVLTVRSLRSSARETARAAA